MSRDDGQIPDERLKRAAQLAIKLREVVDEVADPILRDLVDVVLFEIATKLAEGRR